ncbi:MAG: NAD(P)-dependent oxidoreductase [Verrucomicrobiales bacterium]|nr:NAD(P)-dependent oxidoreductase [Verrucomicrobiales bacterium]
MSKRILVTGSNGFIGRSVVSALRSEGHEVWGLDLAPAEPPGCLVADLLKETETRSAIAQQSPFEAVVHLAALAHGQPPPPGETCFSTNTRITLNLIQALQGTQPQVIFFSSIAVYGEDKRPGAVAPTVDLRPSTEYGRSKQCCEERLLASPIRNIDVLRLAPVFTQARLQDVRKRVFLPGLPFRCRMLPPPRYSLCSLETVVDAVAQRVLRGPHGRTVQNIADPQPYLQSELLEWFSGPRLPVPLALTGVGYLGLKLCPGELGYKLRCLYAKLFSSNVYSLEELPLPVPGSVADPTAS